MNFLVNHEGLSLARTRSGTLKLSEDATGLYSEARLDPTNPVVQQVRSAVERGDLSEMSFAFRVVRDVWNAPDYDDRRIAEVNLDHGDVSVVNFGANGWTADTISIRQRFPGRSAPRVRRADGGDGPKCNRCGGDGSIVLNGKSTTCPQCKGTGGPEGNAAAEAEALSLRRFLSSERRAIALERIRLERERGA